MKIGGSMTVPSISSDFSLLYQAKRIRLKGNISRQAKDCDTATKGQKKKREI